MIRKEFNKNLGKWFLNDCLRAIRRYHMIGNGQPVCVALSGGQDSSVLLYALWYLNHYSPLRFPLYAAHIRTDVYETSVLQDYCDALEVPYLEADLSLDYTRANEWDCALCSRLKRGALKNLLRELGITRLAYGHHGDDAIATLFMNIAQSGRFLSFAPRVAIDGEPLVMIRPLIYVRKETIRNAHEYLGLPLLNYACPLADRGERAKFAAGVAKLEEAFQMPGLVDRILLSYENLTLKDLWSTLNNSD